MSVEMLLYVLVVVSLENLLIDKEFLGLEMKKSWQKYIALLGAFLVGILCFKLGISSSVFNLLWSFILAFFVFQGRIKRRFQCAWVSFLVITHMDVFVWAIAIIAVPPKTLPSSEEYGLACGLAGIFVWIIIWSVSKLRRWKFSSFFVKWSDRQLTLLIIGLLTMGMFIGSVQGFIFEQMTLAREKASLVLCLMSVLFMMIVYGILVRNVQKRKNLEEVVTLNNQYMELQKRYYENSIKKYEELRSYRHDIKNHIQIIDRLCEEKKFNDLAEYIRRLDGDYTAVSSVHTGNSIVDCLLAEMLDGLKEDEVELSVLGRLPEMLPLENVDICILFSNAFRNAEEALKKQTDRKCFHMQIRQSTEEIFIQISNSVTESAIDISATDKKDKEMHGYGTGNMKKVVAKYHGEICWRIEQGMMNVDIYLPYQISSELC